MKIITWGKVAGMIHVWDSEKRALSQRYCAFTVEDAVDAFVELGIAREIAESFSEDQLVGGVACPSV